MSSISRERVLDQFERRLRALTPAMREAWIRGMDTLRGLIPDALLVPALEQGVDMLLAGTLTASTIERAFTELRLGVREILEDAVTHFSRTMPIKLAPTLGADIMHPTIRETVMALDLQYMRHLTGDIQQTVRMVVADGMERQLNANAIARMLRDHIPLAPNQQSAIQNFRRMLLEGDRTAFRRALRDRRFDSTLNRLLGAGKPGLSSRQVNTMVDAYRRRMIAWNANNYARTITSNTMKQGQWLAWQQAALPEGMELWKQWQTVGDNKVREEHAAMAGETQPFDMLYSNQQMVPGDTDFNCRCGSYYFTRITGIIE